MPRQKILLPDTNTILRYLLKDIPDLFKKANDAFELIRLGERQAIILECVILESVYVLTKFYKVPKNDASTAIRNILNYKGIRNPDRNDLVEALDIFASENLDLADCILIAKARSEALELFTFDEGMIKISKKYSTQ